MALSTTEAEYISATEASKEAIWLGRLAKELGMPASTPVLGCDSQSAVYLAKNAMFHARTKHIDVRYHFIRQVLEDGLVTLTKTPRITLQMFSPKAWLKLNMSIAYKWWELDNLKASFMPLSGRLLGLKA